MIGVNPLFPYRIRRVRGYDALAEWQRFVYAHYARLGFLNGNASQEGRLEDQYDAHALHFSVEDAQTGECIGSFRFVFPSDEGLPAEKIFELLHTSPEPEMFIEVTRLIGAKDPSGSAANDIEGKWRSILFPMICYAFAVAVHNQKKGCFAVMDPVTFMRFNRLFANTAEPVEGCEPRFYKGGWLILVRWRVDLFASRVLANDAALQQVIAAIPVEDVQFDPGKRTTEG